jgi:hypothetical protein
MPGVNIIQGLHDKPTRKQSDTRTLSKPKTMDMNTLDTPRLHHHTNASTLLYTLRPGTTTQYLSGSKNNTLEVTMKKPSGNLETRPDHQHILMKPHQKHAEIHPLGDTCLEDSINGSCNPDGLIKNNPEMKRTFQNKVAMRRLTWIIWSPGLVDIKGAHRYHVR